MNRMPRYRHSKACHSGRFLCTVPTLASLLHLSEADVWTLIVGRCISPVGKTRQGDLVFDAVAILERRSASR